MGMRGSSSTTKPSAMRRYRTADVARILGLSPVRVRGMVRAGLCRPERAGRAFEFSFQELVHLRAAQGLLRAGVPLRRVKRSLGELARQLSPDRPLSGVRVYADGRRVIVRDGGAAWQPDSGQGVFVFDVDDLARKTRALVANTQRTVAAASPPRAEESAAQWFERALALEAAEPRAARAAYERALALDPDMTDAYVNLGRLRYEAGDLDAALRLYREALKRDARDPVAHYNLAMVLEDAGDTKGALAHYHHAVEFDPQFADAHYNLGRLLERLGRRTQAFQHLLAYRRLTAGM